jgi:hypothetical protein
MDSKLPEKDFKNSVFLINRWRKEWVDEVLECLKDPLKGKDAIRHLPWYTKHNGFDLETIELFDLRGLFLKNVTLPNVDLTQVCLDYSSFIDTNLHKADIRFSQLRDCRFIRVNLSDADLCVTNFSGGQFIKTDISGADCTGTQFNEFYFIDVKAIGTDMSVTDLTDSIIEYVAWDKKTNWRAVNLKGTIFTHDPRLKRYIEDQNWLAATEKEMRQTWWGSVLWWLWGLTSDYGRSFLRWLLVSLLIAFLYGFLYQFTPLEELVRNVNPVLAKFYFSMVTFTTLGTGDILPKSNSAALLVISEVIIGYLMLGALISILTDKFARRS